MKYMVAPLREQLQELSPYRCFTIEEKHNRFNQDGVIDGNLKKQIKNGTLLICRVFVLTRIFQYISNLSKVFEHLLTHFLQYT